MNALKSSTLVWGNNIIKVVAFVCFLTGFGVLTTDKIFEAKKSNETWMAVRTASPEQLKQLGCLTRNIYWEAANEPFEGKVAVAQVTMNRVESGKFADTICGVVQQKTIISKKSVCQFSWYCNKSVQNRAIHPLLWAEAEEVAKKVFFENLRLPQMEDAMFYHADYVNPHWGRARVTKIGRHIFYK